MAVGTEGLLDRPKRRGPLCGDIGGLLFFVYWMTRARQSPVPFGLGVLVDLATVALVLVALMGYQLAQSSAPSAWLGWSGVAAVGLGFSGSLPLICAGLMLFGISIVRCGVHPGLPWQPGAAARSDGPSGCASVATRPRGMPRGHRRVVTAAAARHGRRAPRRMRRGWP